MKSTYLAIYDGITFEKTTSMKLTHVTLSSNDGVSFYLLGWSRSESNAEKAGKKVCADYLRLQGKTHFYKVIPVTTILSLDHCISLVNRVRKAI